MDAAPDTIVALATSPGRSGIAVIRVSGNKVIDVANSVLKKLPPPRLATYCDFIDSNSQTIDQGLAIYFPAPNSFTGEDVLELQGHGGPVVVNQLISEIVNLGARLAKPGEFSERAFLNDKLDLAQAEAIADLIDATSKDAARCALRSLQGEFSKLINILVEELIYLRTFVEAAIDFVDEEIEFLEKEKIGLRIQQLIVSIENILRDAKQGSLLREGIRAVIAGKPNAGKSSLLNKLSGKETAIVTDIPGTTRDVLHDYILLDGMPIHLIDTAGLRESTDKIEQEGIRRAETEIGKADLVLWVMDGTQPLDTIPQHLQVPNLILIKNKIDKINLQASQEIQDTSITVSLSAKTGEGIDLLKQLIKETVGFTQTNEGTFSARARHIDALQRAKAFTQNALQHKNSLAFELLAEELRLAQSALSEITGEFTSDQLLGRIFGSFCIGK